MATPNITTQLFIGYLINSELRVHLNSSELWQQNQSFSSDPEVPLKKVHHEENDYIGIFTESDSPHLPEINQYKEIVFHGVSKLCPEIKVDRLKMVTFPQVFLS
jgi:hypothetical protein